MDFNLPLAGQPVGAALRDKYNAVRAAYDKVVSLNFTFTPKKNDRQLANDIAASYSQLRYFSNWAYRQGLGAYCHRAYCTWLLRDMEGREGCAGACIAALRLY